MPDKPSTLTLDFARITTAKQLETAIGLGPAAGNPAWRTECERRARQLDAEHLLPSSWAAAPKPTTPAPAAKPAEPASLLEETPAALMELGRRDDLDRVLRAMSVELNIDAATALDSLVLATMKGRELARAAPLTVGDILHSAGVKELEVFTADVKMLEQRDAAVARTLEAGEAQLAEQTVNERGQVMCDADLDLPALLSDRLSRERRWRRARAVSGNYADRARWEADDLLHLEGGIDLCATLERGPQVAAVHQKAIEVGNQLDGIIEAGREPAARIRELDAAISTLSAERTRIAPKAAGSVPTVRELDRPEGGPTRFIDLTSKQMVLVLERYDARGTKSLDQLTQEVIDGIPAAAPDYPHVTAGNAPLHEQIQAHVQQHGCNYLCGLQAVTGVGLGR